VIVEWLLIVLITIVFTWLYNRAKGSILVTALIHPAMNTTGAFLNASPFALLLLLGFVVFVIVLDKMWKKLPEDNLAVYTETAAVGLTWLEHYDTRKGGIYAAPSNEYMTIQGIG